MKTRRVCGLDAGKAVKRCVRLGRGHACALNGPAQGFGLQTHEPPNYHSESVVIWGVGGGPDGLGGGGGGGE